MNPALPGQEMQRLPAHFRTIPGLIAKFYGSGNIRYPFFGLAQKIHIFFGAVEPGRELEQGHRQLPRILYRGN
ncbi:hypothetical protein D3C73_970940 [compost metagenome]